MAKCVSERQPTPTWSGTATELRAELDDRADEKTRRLKSWPQTARTLSGTVKRLAPNLRAVGIEVDFTSEGRGRAKKRVIVLRRLEQESIVPSDPSDPNTGNCDSGGDAGNANGDDGDATGTHEGGDVTPCHETVGTHGDDGDAKLHPHSAEVVEWTG